MTDRPSDRPSDGLGAKALEPRAGQETDQKAERKAERHSYKFGLIGNCAYMAYIDMQANVVWQCLPRFDSSFIFGGLLDPEKGGRFSISPQSDEECVSQKYLENTNILSTRFKTEDGEFEV